MDILYQLSDLLFQDAETLEDKSPEYRSLKSLERQLLGQIPQDLQEKLMDVQQEISCHTLLDCFLYGLQVGFAASDLGKGG